MKKTPSRPRPACSVNLFGQLDSIRATCERNMLGPNPTLARLDYPSSSSSGEDDDEDRYGGGDGDRCGGDVGEDQFGNRDKFGNYGEAEKDKYGADKDITYKRGGAGMRHKYGGLMYARGGGPEHAPAGGTLRASMGDGTGAIEDGGVDGDDSEDDISNELSKPPRKGGFASEAPASLSSAYSLKHSVASLKEAVDCQESCLRAILEKQVSPLLDPKGEQWMAGVSKCASDFWPALVVSWLLLGTYNPRDFPLGEIMGPTVERGGQAQVVGYLLCQPRSMPEP
eukprot:jgi/Mesvir1/24295/Mv10989-RA.3